MGHETKFTPEDAAAIGNLSQILRPFLDRHPHLARVDLVIEGGVGTGIIMPHVTKGLFPKAIYVGTDLQPLLAHKISLARLKGQVDEATVERLIKANQLWQLDMRDSTLIYANCFDFPLVRDLCAKLQRDNPVLVSFNAIGALTDKHLTHYDKKTRADHIYIDRWFVDSPFIAQLHVANWDVNWNGSGDTFVNETFTWIRDAAIDAGYAVEELPLGLLAVRQ